MRLRHTIVLFALVSFVILGIAGFSAAQTSPKKASYDGSRVKNYSRFVEIAGAKRVGADTCTTCHSDVSKDFQHAFHAQQGVECEDCHGNGSSHVDGGGDVAKIVSFRMRAAADANGVCLSCHAQNEKVRNWMTGKHSSNHVRCIDCHQIHTNALREASVSRISFDTATRAAFAAASVSPETNVFVRAPSATNEACLRCHQTERAQLSLPYHHPLREGKMSCNDCHDPHGGPTGNNLKTASVNQLCLTCHAQYRGPYAYQHPPVTENCLNCHNVHGSPNTNILKISEPALCLQCHAGHHDGASLPLPDRCTNCHLSIHGTDTPTASGGTRFVDKGPSEPALLAAAGAKPVTDVARVRAMGATVSSPTALARANVSMAALPASAAAMGNWVMGLIPMGFMAPMQGGGNAATGNPVPGGYEAATGDSAFSVTPGAYRFVDAKGFLGRVAEYDSLQESAGTDAEVAFVSPERHLTIVSRANVISGDDYTSAMQLTAGERLRVGLAIRSFEQQQDHYPFYAFPFLDVTPGTATPCVPGSTCVDTTNDLIGSGQAFAVTRRLGDAYAQFKVPKLPVHLYVRGNWEARAGLSQLGYLDENTTPAVFVGGVNTTCGAQCHFQSQFQPVNYTTRNIGGGADVKLGQILLSWEHYFSSFNDRLQFPVGTFTGEFTPENEGISSTSPPPSGPFPPDVAIGNYAINPPSQSQSSTDSVRLNWTASPQLTFNGGASYTRLRDLFTHYPQYSFDSDTKLNWRPANRLGLIADYHQQNLINDFVPYYSMYGNVSSHDHWEGLRLDYELPKGFDVEIYYRRGGITRSNASLWQQTSANTLGIPSQIYSIDNSDLLKVVPASFSNTTGLDVRYHENGHWSARVGYEWTGTHDPGYLIEPKSNNRAFAGVWLTPTDWLVLSNDTSIILQNAFPAIPLLRPDGNGVSGDFQRRNRFYNETASATAHFVSGWTLALGYSYQQNNLTTYMAFQNLPGATVGYFLDEPAVPYKQIAQVYWGESTYTVKQRLGINLKVTYNSARSGMRPDVNPADAAKLGNAALISQGAFDPNGLFVPALNNLSFAATKISQVIVPQWIGQGKVYYLFPRKFEGGFVFYYGSYRDYFNPNLNGDLRTATLYLGRSW